MEIILPGGKKVDALYKDFTIKTDQPKQVGGEGSAPSPFDLFLASLGTCAGFYVLSFCQSRDVATEGIKLRLNVEWNNQAHLISKVSIQVELPSDFPDKYKVAVVRAAESCTVKKHLQNPPEIQITTI